MSDFENEAWLHLYAQSQWHDEAHIVGTRRGLEALRDAINAALSDDHGHYAAEAFTTDGEGYSVEVACVPYGEMDRMQLPYTDRDLFNPNGEAGRMWPWHLPRKAKPLPPTPMQEEGKNDR